MNYVSVQKNPFLIKHLDWSISTIVQSKMAEDLDGTLKGINMYNRSTQTRNTM